jgi:hypothetical protein
MLPPVAAANSPFPDFRSVPNKLARTSLLLGLLGWFFYLLQACFDFSLGLLLAAVTAGTSAVCSSILDILPFALWLAGIVAGHVALGQLRQSGDPGRSSAVWGLLLSYAGLAFTILFIVGIIILVASGVGAGLLYKFLPSLPKHY